MHGKPTKAQKTGESQTKKVENEPNPEDIDTDDEIEAAMKQQEMKKAEKQEETEEIERVIKKSDAKPEAQVDIIKVFFARYPAAG